MRKLAHPVFDGLRCNGLFDTRLMPYQPPPFARAWPWAQPVLRQGRPCSRVPHKTREQAQDSPRPEDAAAEGGFQEWPRITSKQASLGRNVRQNVVTPHLTSWDHKNSGPKSAKKQISRFRSRTRCAQGSAQKQDVAEPPCRPPKPHPPCTRPDPRVPKTSDSTPGPRLNKAVRAQGGGGFLVWYGMPYGRGAARRQPLTFSVGGSGSGSSRRRRGAGWCTLGGGRGVAALSPSPCKKGEGGLPSVGSAP